LVTREKHTDNQHGIDFVILTRDLVCQLAFRLGGARFGLSGICYIS
jgi:hypothetical protein